MNSRSAARQLSRLIISCAEAQGYSALRCSSALASHANSSNSSNSPPLYRVAMSPWQHSRFCSESAASRIEKLADEAREVRETKKSISEALVRLEAEAMELASEGQTEKASEMMEEAFTLVSNTKGMGAQCLEAGSIFVAHISILQRVSEFEKLIKVVDETLPKLEGMRDGELIPPIAILRKAAALICLGEPVKASEELQRCGELLQALQDADETKIPPFLPPEYTFYSTLLDIFLCQSPEDVKKVENVLLGAISGMRESVPDELGAEFPYIASALQAHSRMLHAAIENSAPSGIIHALFSQVKMLQRAAGCSTEELALVDYQHGTWTYAETDDLQHAKDLIEESAEELRKVHKERTGQDDVGTGGDGVFSEETKKDAESTNMEHQLTLRKLRMAVIDTVMVATRARAASRDLSSSAQGTLSTVAAAYEDLLGESNALSAEARFCLSLWGVHEGLLDKPHGEKERVTETVKENMRKCLRSMAMHLAGGSEHMLVQKLLHVSEDVVGSLDMEKPRGAGGDESDSESAGSDAEDDVSAQEAGKRVGGAGGVGTAARGKVAL